MTYDPYFNLDRDFNTVTGTDIGFESLIIPESLTLDDRDFERFQARYAIIRDFQERVLALFQASLRGEADPRIAQMIIGDAPSHADIAYHRQLDDLQHRPPVFFRTDEPAPGQLSEIQCPGSGWCLHEQMRSHLVATGKIPPLPRFSHSLPKTFFKTLRNYLGGEPVVHHLTENASRPHGMRYFIQKTREQGVRYLSYDRGIGPGDCNFLRSHDYISILSHNFHQERLQRCSAGELRYDLPPSLLFDGKLPLALPFWEPSRALFDDAIRSILPYTTPIEAGGIHLEDGTRVTLEAFSDLPASTRDYYLKYAGTDVSINWGSRSVFLASSSTRAQCRDLMARIAKETSLGRPWIAQRAQRTAGNVPVIDRTGRAHRMDGYLKWSGFYGPGGLMGIMVMCKNFAKVHGSGATALGIVA